ncbi:MAG: MCP four helix bundle domain-containing protein [Deltaproteobacteria bacterium]|nr:MCP four helix bundle domain-containing protein [Deltaproteobacteria bacterium]
MFRFLNRLNLMKKLLVGPVVVILFLVLLAAMSYQGLATQKSALNEIYQVEFKNYQLFSKLQGEVAMVHGNINKLMNWINTNTNKAKVEELQKALGKALAATADQLNKFMRQPGRSAEEKKTCRPPSSS